MTLPGDGGEPRTRVLFTARWYPSYDQPVRGSFVADLVRAGCAAGFDISVASWETVVDGRHADPARPSPAMPGTWREAIRERARPVAPVSWGVHGVPVVRLPAPTRVVDGVRDDAVTVAGAESEALLAWSASPTFVAPSVIHAHTGLPD